MTQTSSAMFRNKWPSENFFKQKLLSAHSCFTKRAPMIFLSVCSTRNAMASQTHSLWYWQSLGGKLVGLLRWSGQKSHNSPGTLMIQKNHLFSPSPTMTSSLSSILHTRLKIAIVLDQFLEMGMIFMFAMTPIKNGRVQQRLAILTITRNTSWKTKKLGRSFMEIQKGRSILR